MLGGFWGRVLRGFSAGGRLVGQKSVTEQAECIAELSESEAGEVICTAADASGSFGGAVRVDVELALASVKKRVFEQNDY